MSTMPSGAAISRATNDTNSARSEAYAPSNVNSWLHRRKRQAVRDLTSQPRLVEEDTSDVTPSNVPEQLMVSLPPFVSTAPREETLQEWEGRVVSVHGDTFTARLLDITAGEQDETEEVELPKSDLSYDDLLLLKEGSIFRWLIGYRYHRGTKERFARIVFRRLPIWTAEEIDAADAEAKRLANAIKWE